MNKKRFSIKYDTASTNYPTGRVFDNEKQHTLYIDEVVNLLNWLINENKELKKKLKIGVDKMNEERFVKNRYVYGYEVPLNVPTQSVPVITDTLNRKHYYSLREVVGLLNEQQSIIHKDEISIETMMSNMEKLEKENKELQKELDSFRPVLFHDMRIGTITLYTKGGINE